MLRFYATEIAEAYLTTKITKTYRHKGHQEHEGQWPFDGPPKAATATGEAAKTQTVLDVPALRFRSLTGGGSACCAGDRRTALRDLRVLRG
jgi:hypothetical protein